MKKVLSMVLSICMLLSITSGLNISAYALADSGQCGDYVYYTFDSAMGKLTISGTGAMYNYSDSSTSSHYYTRNPFYYASRIKSVVIEYGVTSIGDRAFYCSGLTSVEIPESVKRIGVYSFNGCDGLTSLEIPSSVTSVLGISFAHCSNLTNIVVDSNNTVYDSRDNCNAIIKKSDNSLVAGCKNTVIPNGVTSIGGYAFCGCTDLHSTSSVNIVIPYGVTSIGDHSFAYCHGTINIEIPNSVTRIEREAFFNSTGLKSITIPDSVTYIGDSAFNACGLKRVNINSIEKWCGITFEGADANPLNYAHNLYLNDELITEIKIPNSVTSIKPCAFVGFSGLNITLSESVTSIGGNAFNGCTGLTDIEIPNGVTGIGGYAFSGCTNISSVNIPNGVSAINGGTFEYCTNLKSVEIPNSIKYIDWRAFHGCSSLQSVEIPSSVISIDERAFSYCSSLTSLSVDAENTFYDSRNNCNAIIKTSDNQLVVGCKNTIIPNNVTSIGWNAFNGCTGLTDIEIPNGVTGIGTSAFSGCTELTSVTIPNSVIGIGDSAFEKCSSLTSISIPDKVSSINEYTFKNCTGLTSITIPKSVKKINSYAFDNCPVLSDVYYTSSQSDWSNIRINGYGNDDLKKATIHYNYNAHIPAESVIENEVAATWTANGSYDKVVYCSECGEELSRVTKIVYLSGACGTNADYSFNASTGKLTINGSGNIYDYGLSNSPFYNQTSIVTVSFASSITRIGDNAFNKCTGLTDVYYTGSKSEWDDISIGVKNECLKNATIHCSDGIIGGTDDSVTLHAFDQSLTLSDITGSSSFQEYVKAIRSTSYNQWLSYILSLLARSAYDRETLESNLIALGYNQRMYANYNDDDLLAGHYIAKKTLSDGTTVVLVVIRGSSNFANWLGNLTPATTGLVSGKHWAFEASAQNVYDNINAYLGGIPKDNVKYVITGHSLGGATGNLLAVKLHDNGVPKENVIDYNYACPDVAKSVFGIDWNPDGIHDNIFNLGDARDAVTVLPGIALDAGIGSWGKYGKSYWFSYDWNNSLYSTITFDSHDAKNYVNYMSRLDNDSKFRGWAGMEFSRTAVYAVIHMFDCPVDVRVYNESGDIIAEVVDNKAKYYGDLSDVFVAVERDRKYVAVPPDKNYKIKITGNDTGEMTYTVMKNEASEESQEKKIFESVQLTAGKEMITTATEDNISEAKLFVVDENDNAVAEITENGTETEVSSGGGTGGESGGSSGGGGGGAAPMISECDISGHKTSTTGEVQTPATTEKEGVMVFKCTVCGAVIRTEAIPKLSANEPSNADTKAANPVKISAKTAKASAKTLKKKDLTIAIEKLVKIENAKGKLSFEKVKGNSKIKLNKKTGTVRLKKGLKKGTYKVKIKVKDSGDKSFKAKSKTVTVTIKVK